jgi:hypothetical protein
LKWPERNLLPTSLNHSQVSFKLTVHCVVLGFDTSVLVGVDSFNPLRVPVARLKLCRIGRQLKTVIPEKVKISATDLLTQIKTAPLETNFLSSIICLFPESST